MAARAMEGSRRRCTEGIPKCGSHPSPLACWEHTWTLTARGVSGAMPQTSGGSESPIFFPRCGRGQRERPLGPGKAPRAHGRGSASGRKQSAPFASSDSAATATLEHRLRPGRSFKYQLNGIRNQFQSVLQLPSII